MTLHFYEQMQQHLLHNITY